MHDECASQVIVRSLCIVQVWAPVPHVGKMLSFKTTHASAHISQVDSSDLKVMYRDVLIYTCVMLDKPMMKEMKQIMRMKTFFLFLSSMGYSSARAVMKPSTVQN